MKKLMIEIDYNISPFIFDTILLAPVRDIARPRGPTIGIKDHSYSMHWCDAFCCASMVAFGFCPIFVLQGDLDACTVMATFLAVSLIINGTLSNEKCLKIK